MSNTMEKYIISHRSGCGLCPPEVFDTHEECIAYIEDQLATFVRDYVYSEYGEDSEEYQAVENLTNEDVVLWGEEKDLVCNNCFTGYGDWEEFDYKLVEISVPQEQEHIPHLNIEEMAYELYKEDWFLSYNSPKEILDIKRIYYEELQECLEKGWDIESYEKWIFDVGFGNGSLYVCFDEFVNCEFQDKEYMKYLLGEQSNLYGMYLEFMETELEEERE